MDRDSLIFIVILMALIIVTNISTAVCQRDFDIEKIKDAVIENPEITCMEYLQSIED